MEWKYGRLRQVSVSSEGGEEKVVDTFAKWDDDEPLFLFRSTDRLAPYLIWQYYEALRREGRNQLAMGVHAQYQAMLDWQRTHPDRVKLPD